MVQPVIKDGTMPPPHPRGTVAFFNGATALNPSGVPLVAGTASKTATFAQVFGAPDPAVANSARPNGISGDFNGDGTPDLLVHGTGGPLLVQVFASIPGGKFVVLPVQSFSLPQESR